MPLTHFSLLRIGGESDDSVYGLLDSSHYLYWYGNSLRGQHQYDVHSIGCCHSFVMFGRLAFRGDFTHYYFDNLICCSSSLFNFALLDMIRQDSIVVTIWFDSSSIIIIDSFYLNTVLWLSKLNCALLVILEENIHTWSYYIFFHRIVSWLFPISSRFNAMHILSSSLISPVLFSSLSSVLFPLFCSLLSLLFSSRLFPLSPNNGSGTIFLFFYLG